MEEWKDTRIGDVCIRVCSGGTPSSRHLEYYDGDIPWLNTKEINFNRIYSTERCITEEGLANSSAKWIEENAVIVAMYGATAGKTAINKIPLTTNQACCNLTIDSKKADFRFIYYALNNKFSELASLANGGAQQNLNAQIIKDFEVLLPSLPIQRQIASILSSLDDKIELNRKINANLEAQAQALFKSWFVDFEPFKDQPFVESELGMIPEGWRVTEFKEFIHPMTEKVSVGCLPEYSVTNNGIIPRDAKFNKKLSKETSKNKVLRKNNLVFGMSREILNWGIMEDEIGGVSSAYNIFEINEGIISPVFLRLYMTAKISDFNSLIGTAAREGQSLDKGALMQKTIYIPPKEIVEKFFEIYFSITALKKEAEQESRRLASLRDTLLPRLMSGELKVNDVNI